MSDLISRDSLTEKLRGEMADISRIQFEASVNGYDIDEMMIKAVYRIYQRSVRIVLDESAVTMKPEERTKGKWQWLSSTMDRVPCEQEYVCSECSHKIIINNHFVPWEHFCPNCGADMREELK